MAGNSRYKALSAEISHKLGSHSALRRLCAVWAEIGLDEGQMRTRMDVVVVHLNNLLEEMVTEEESLRDKLLNNIDKYGADLLRLTKELALPPYEPSSELTNVQLEKDLRRRVGALEAERQDRLRRLKTLRDTDQRLCDVMVTTPYYIATGSVPSLTQLDELQAHIDSLQAEKERRHAVFTSTKRTILRMLDELEKCPNTSFERELVCEEEDSFLLTSENMSALKHYAEELEKQQQENFALASRFRDHMETLWERLKLPAEERTAFNTQHTGFRPKVIDAMKAEIARCELLKLQNMQQVIESTRRELTEWWDRCYYSPEQRRDFTPFYDDVYTEETLTRHEDEVASVRRYYDENRELLELVSRRQTLFEQFLEHERKAADPNRLFNRGFNLLKEEKARKKVDKDLPRVEEDVKQKIAEWEQKTGKSFIIGGLRFVDFIQRQWEDFRTGKENEKVQRHQAKVKLLEEEMLYGSRPTATTPGKKRTITASSRTPNKKFRQDNGPPIAVYNSTASSLSSASTMSTDVSAVSTRLPPSGHTRHRAKGNETSKTPNAHTPGFNRTGRTNHTAVYSPVCMPPRSKAPASRRPLADSNDTVFSQTTVSSQGAKKDSTEEASLASIEPYTDFARGLNQNARPNCRSSILPQPQKPVYF